MNLDQAYIDSGMRRIDVDITSVSAFADVLRREIETNLAPAWQQLQRTLGQGAQFALSPELGELSAKREDYETYLDQSKRLFRDVIEGVYQFAEGADKIAANYRRADQFAKVTADDVNQMMPVVPTRSRPDGPQAM